MDVINKHVYSYQHARVKLDEYFPTALLSNCSCSQACRYSLLHTRNTDTVGTKLCLHMSMCLMSLSLCVRAPLFCVSTLRWMRASNLKSERQCTGRHKGCSKLGIKLSYPEKYQLSPETSAHQLSVALPVQYSVSWLSLLFWGLTGAERWKFTVKLPSITWPDCFHANKNFIVWLSLS